MILMGANDDEILVCECCPLCGREATILWNVRADGLHAFCPYCGERLMLCSECHENCSYCTETDSCKMQENHI